ncbi:MAG: helix-turn-helix transcriptional regulator [Rubrobacteraceae bacterium]|nr:helix-turn-helix transcriptional regulator [Rubrobacteraceae bacterium]
MCGRSVMVRGAGFGGRRRRPEFFGIDAEKLGPRTKVGVALSVLAPVALSGVLLVALVPGLWWIFTTYFWVAFPAIGLLGSGLTGLGEERRSRPAAVDLERELLAALMSHGEMTAAGIAAQTSLSVDEADRRLRELAEAGHLEVRVRGGGLFYALWEAEGRQIEGVR